MRKTERFTRIILVLLAVMSITAVILQVINNNTGPIETAYEIITFSVAAIALTLAITQGIYNTRTTNELRKIIHNIHEVEKVDTDNEIKLSEKIDQNLELNKQVIDLIKNK